MHAIMVRKDSSRVDVAGLSGIMADPRFTRSSPALSPTALEFIG
jgi:hypothetical protein